MRQIFLDTETTGLSPANGDRVLNLACVEMISRKITRNDFHCYINPERESHEDALRVHGLTTEFLADKPKFADIAQEFLDFVQGAEIIIHNAPFDVGFLDAELQRAGHAKFSTHVGKITDSLAMAKELFPGKRNGLDALCERMGVDNSDRTLHGALLDAQLLAEVYINLTRGQDALLIDSHATTSSQGSNTVQTDFSKLDLIVLQPSEAELAAHEDVLKQIDKSSGGKTVWRSPASV
ncbi:MAG: DNA polymerase III subunit epsilon [Brachymonas sp.]